MYAAGPDDSDAPGFSDVPVAGGHQNGDGADFGDGEAPGFNGQAEPSAYGDTPGYGGGQAEPSAFGDAPAFGGEPDGGYGPAQGVDVFGHQNAAPAHFTGHDEPGQGYTEGQQQGFGESQGYGDGQQGQYVGPVTGEFRGDYESGYSGSPDAGFGAAQGDGGFGAAQSAAFGGSAGAGFGGTQDGGLPGAGGPGIGTAYGDQGYQAGQENGARTMDPATAYPPQYRPVEPPKSRMTASLRSVKRRGFGSSKRNDQGRQAQLTVGRVEPWSVMKFSFVISLVAFIVLFVAVAVLYAALSGLGVFHALQHSVQNITSSQGSKGFNLMTYLSASRVLGYTGLLGAINVVLITALCTVGSVLYNLTANLAGGVEITLKESD